MSKITYFSRILKWLFLINVFLVPIPAILFFIDVPKSWLTGMHVSLTINSLNITPNLLNTLGWGQWIATLVMLFIPVVLSMMLMYQLYLLFSSYSEGDIFSLETTSSMTKIGFLLFLRAIAELVTSPFIIYTISKQHAISLGINSGEISNIIIALILFIIAKIMQEGYRLKSEAALTI